MSVYFIEDEHCRVKIGWAVNPTKRLSGLQAANADLLRIIRVVEGGELTEWVLKRHFKKLRVRGEWFRYSPEMLSIEVPSEPPEPARLPPPPRSGNIGDCIRQADALDLLDDDQRRYFAPLLTQAP